MSVKVVENTVRIADVDVDESMKENVVQTELSGDSGAESFDTASVSCPTSSDSDVSPTKPSSSPFTKYAMNSTDFGFRDNSPLKSASESLSSKNCESPLPADDYSQKNYITNHISFENNINIDGKNLQNQINTEILQYNNESGFKHTENADIVAAVDSSNQTKPPQCENVTDGETNSNENMEHSNFEQTKGALHSIKDLIIADSLIDVQHTIETNSKAETISDRYDNSADYQKNNSMKSVENATNVDNANVESLIDTVSLKDNQNVNSKDLRATQQKTGINPDDNNVTDMTQVENSDPNKNAHIVSDSATVSRNHNKSDNNISKDEINQISNISYKSLTTSTTSLNNEIQSNSINNSKSPYSRSAENIFTLEENIPSSSEPSTKDLNTDQILSEFTNQKNKVKATQKIIIDTPQTVNIDLRYARIPKEILSQDLGSIAKSVHGIFSSVSGSLKNAYNNTQRPAVKLPMKVVKPVNGKVINEIFEDNVPEPSIVNDSLVPEKEKLNLNTEDSASADITDDDTKKDLTKLQIESLERVLAEQRKENAALRERVKQQVDELQAKDHTFKELEAKVDLMCKRTEQALKEKDAAVMRYASVECQAIEAKKAAETAAKNERAAVAEKELLNGKLKSARDDRERICQMYDDKCHELKTSEAEIAKLREELREIDGRLKWTQSKLRVEMDAYKECSERAEKLSQQVAELEAARDTAAVNASDSAKAKQFEAELKECRAALILCRHEKEELEKRWSAATQQLETCRKERDVANEARLAADAEIERLKESNLRLEEEAAELAALRAQAALADTLSSQLQRETERAAQAEAALSLESARAETCARREAAALEHAARLTAQHVAQRAAHTDNDAKAQALAADNASLRERIVSLEEECGRLKMALEEETERRNKENRVLARKVAELTEEAAEANKKLEWEKGENGVLKKKHASAIKELNRELQRAMKRVEQLEAKLPQPNASDAPSTRTGSITSLSSGESAHDDRFHNGHSDVPDVQSGPLPERQALIERIVSLQRAAARRAERCEFLEEHSRHLTEELRGKNKLLRHLLPALPAGALASHQSDTHKKEIARLGGGAMAALWGGESGGMTPELALEVAARLQAVLEDTLLKNITLKENIDTLGEEIAMLRKQVNSSNDSK